MSGDVQKAEGEIKKVGANFKDDYNFTALHIAARYGAYYYSQSKLSELRKNNQLHIVYD